MELRTYLPDDMPRLRSFCEWLPLHASSLRRLKLELGVALHILADGEEEPVMEDDDERNGDSGREALALLTAIPCAAAGSLTHLDLGYAYVLSGFRISSWVLALRRLHTLRAEFQAGPLEVVVPLQALTALQRLELKGKPLLLRPCALLPTSLTKLKLESGADFAMDHRLPPQVRF